MQTRARAKTGVLLVNLGSPLEPTAAGVRQFLRDFLGDPRVVEVPRPVWWLVLHGIILPFRSPKVAKLYHEIWWEEGSPLRVITRRQTAKLQQLLQQDHGDAAPVVQYAMTYGKPSIAESIAGFVAQGIERILVLPLYPQFSATTTGPVYDQVAAVQQQSRNIPDIRIVKQYYDDPAYIAALADSVRQHWATSGKTRRLLVSYHGLPQRCVDKGDPYYAQCMQTTTALAAELGLAAEECHTTFQSRFGPAQWLQPYTADTLQQWGASGVDSVTVICPAFAADCLETLEEMDGQNRTLFLGAGGKVFERVACLNESENHIGLFAGIVAKNLWPDSQYEK